VSDGLLNDLRFVSMIAVVPLTTRLGLSPSFYPLLVRRKGGLPEDGTALPDQLRTIDKSRVSRVAGFATAAELAAIELSLRRFLRLPMA
jgi:mRNA-degrading endonuclease toxin of MazEF toxin-antitoxin module